ncbi:MAG: universal stress protein [Comamonadaceae bacterium]|nr:universal stress protein [Comamonadaceae bacterium]
MLQEGHRLKSEGIDVVIGLLETHGRADISRLAEGLEVVPRRVQEYHGIAIEEMDAEAVVARKPQVALIDELAHTNVPGSRNAKRYEDVQDILAAGIHVITHAQRPAPRKPLQRRGDVRRGQGPRAPSRFRAGGGGRDRRRRPGDRGPPASASRRARSTRPSASRPRWPTSSPASNLEKLRELTLRELAAQIDLRRREAQGAEGGAASDQVMVCLSSHGPNSEKLLRYGSRLAGKLNRNWYAVYVQTPAEEATVIDARIQRQLSETLTLAKQLGAMVFTYKGEDIAETILRFAAEYRVGHIVVGKSSPRPLWKRIGRNKKVVKDLIGNAQGATVIVVDPREALPAAAPVLPELSEQPAPTAPAEGSGVQAVDRPRLSLLSSPGTS